MWYTDLIDIPHSRRTSSNSANIASPVCRPNICLTESRHVKISKSSVTPCKLNAMNPAIFLEDQMSRIMLTLRHVLIFCLTTFIVRAFRRGMCLYLIACTEGSLYPGIANYTISNIKNCLMIDIL